MFIFNEKKKRKKKGLYIFDSTTQKLGNLILNLRLKHKQNKKLYDYQQNVNYRVII